MANGLSAYLQDDEELDPAPTPLMQYMAVNDMSTPAPTPSAGALAKMYEELSRQATASEEAGLEGLERYIAEYAGQERPTDYRALAAWADTLRPGTKLYQMAESTAPESLDAKQQKLLALQQQLQQRKGAFSQRQLSGLQTLLSQQAQADRLAHAQAQAQARFDQQQELAKQKFEQEKLRTQAYQEGIKAKERIAAQQLAASKGRVEKQQADATARQEAGLAEKREKKVEDQLIKFEQKAVDAIPIVENLKVIEDILGGNLEQFDPKTGTVNGKKIDLPGASVPGVGRVFAPGSVGESLQSAFSNIFNTTLKERSGAAVTDQELQRLKNEFAQGKFNTEEKMIEALQRYKNILRKRMRQHEAAYSPEVRARYRTQGGMLADDLLPESGAGAPPPPPSAPVQGGERFKAGEAPWEVGQ